MNSRTKSAQQNQIRPKQNVHDNVKRFPNQRAKLASVPQAGFTLAKVKLHKGESVDKDCTNVHQHDIDDDRPHLPEQARLSEDEVGSSLFIRTRATGHARPTASATTTGHAKPTTSPQTHDAEDRRVCPMQFWRLVAEIHSAPCDAGRADVGMQRGTGVHQPQARI